jgi:hypothetical protein
MKMKLFLSSSLAALAVVIGGIGSTATAQYQPAPVNPFQQSPVSPYINIVRRGAPPAVNYFNIVQPQLQFQSQIGQLQQQQAALAQTGGTLLENQPLTTGHPIQFGNYSHYFGNRLTGIGGSSLLRGSSYVGAGGFPQQGLAGAPLPSQGSSGRPSAPSVR